MAPDQDPAEDLRPPLEEVARERYLKYHPDVTPEPPMPQQAAPPTPKAKKEADNA